MICKDKIYLNEGIGVSKNNESKCIVRHYYYFDNDFILIPLLLKVLIIVFLFKALANLMV